MLPRGGRAWLDKRGGGCRGAGRRMQQHRICGVCRRPWPLACGGRVVLPCPPWVRASLQRIRTARRVDCSVPRGVPCAPPHSTAGHVERLEVWRRCDATGTIDANDEPCHRQRVACRVRIRWSHRDAASSHMKASLRCDCGNWLVLGFCMQLKYYVQ